MKNIREAIISLDIMPRKTYDKFNKFAHLQNASPAKIWEHYPSTGLNNYNPNKMVLEASIIETYLLINYLKDNNVKLRLWYNNPLFIHNDDLYRIKGNEIIKEDIQNLYFVSMREALSHPFHLLIFFARYQRSYNVDYWFLLLVR